jgi:hypothetical protein
MSKELSCGKAPKRTKGFGAQSMTNPQMKDFIEKEGTPAALKALYDIQGPVSRGQLCVIFHMFRKGREEIAKGDIGAGFRLTPSPNRAKPASPPKRKKYSPESIPLRARGRSSQVQATRRSGSNSSPNYSPNKLLKIFAFSKAKERRRLLKAGLKGLKPKRPGYVRKEHGLNVYVKYPPQHYRSTTVPSDLGYESNHRNVAGRSNSDRSNKSQVSNYYTSGNNSNRGFGATNFQNLRAKFNKEPKKARAASRFARAMKSRAVKSFKIRKTKPINVRQYKVNRIRSLGYLPFPTSASSLTRRPTHTRQPVAGSRSQTSRAQLRAANNARWKEYEKLIKNQPNLSPNSRASLANKLMQKALANVKEGKIVPATRARPYARAIMKSIGLGSSSSSSSASGSPRRRSPKAKISTRRIQERIQRRMRMIERRKYPQVNIAKEFERGMLKGPQGEKVSLRKTAEERARAKEFEKQLIKFNSPKKKGQFSSSSSGSASPKKNSPKKSAAASSSGMKSLRRAKK